MAMVMGTLIHEHCNQVCITSSFANLGNALYHGIEAAMIKDTEFLTWKWEKEKKEEKET